MQNVAEHGANIAPEQGRIQFVVPMTSVLCFEPSNYTLLGLATLKLDETGAPTVPIETHSNMSHHVTSFTIMLMVLNLMGQGTSAAQVAPPTPTSTGSPRKSRDRERCAMAQHETVQICQVGEAGELEGLIAMWVQRVWVF